MLQKSTFLTDKPLCFNFMHCVKKNNFSTAPRNVSDSNNSYRRYNFQAFANISRNIKFPENLQPHCHPDESLVMFFEGCLRKIFSRKDMRYMWASIWVVYDVKCIVYAYRHVGGLLDFTDNQCCIVEDSDMAVSGYVVTCPDAGQYYKWFEETWLPSLRDKCPKLSATDSDSKVCLETCTVVWFRCLSVSLLLHPEALVLFRLPTHPWKYLNFFLLNSRPWKYLKTGQMLESPWIHQVRLCNIGNFVRQVFCLKQDLLIIVTFCFYQLKLSRNHRNSYYMLL